MTRVTRYTSLVLTVQLINIWTFTQVYSVMTLILRLRKEATIKGQLQEHPNHPKGRNTYAHVAICIKNKFNQSYKDIPDEKYNEVIKYINFLKENPS